jgi:transcription initiation factor IIE alpha subunit
MAEATYFEQECPTCGRNLRIRVEYLGKRLVCQHCHGSLVASDPEASVHPGFDLLQRASELIERAERQRPRAR